jgi:hypothetical protein
MQTNVVCFSALPRLAPTCSPKLLSAQTTSSTSVRLTWTPTPDNECRNGIIRGYRIGYILTEGKHPETITVDNPSTTSHDVTGLDTYTWYTFSVLAYTVDDGPWSNLSLRSRTDEAGK